MASMVRRITACVAIGALALAFSFDANAQDKKKDDKKKDDKPATISEIMKKGHAGAKSLIKGIGAQVKEGKWSDAEDGAKTLKFFGESLGKNKPNKGDDESWKKLSGEYKDQTVAVFEGVEKKDAKAAGDALGKIGKSCKGCHDMHK
jgi:hypothetical protein